MKTIKTTLYIFTLLFLVACGKDRSDEYFALINDDLWIENTMKEHYLWYKDMPSVSKNDYFAEPSNFLSKVLFKGNSDERADIFSYIKDKKESNSRSFLQRTSTYGFDFQLYSDPTQKTNHLFARVLFVLSNSPAQESGLERGDWISEINGQTINKDNYGYLINGGNRQFTILNLVDNNGSLSWQTDKTLDISPARNVEINPFYVDTTYTYGNKKISYLVYNEFSTGPNNEASETQYAQEMKQIFSNFKTKGTTDLILDLRYNPGGYLSQAIILGSMIAPINALGKTFYTLEYNDKTSPREVSSSLLSIYSSYNLNIPKIYIITSGLTASASETLINCLKPYYGDDNVILIGEKTFGKNVIMAPYTKNDINFILWPVVAYAKNSEGFYQFQNGISPTYELSEVKLLSRYLPLGNTEEYLLKNTISLITNGSLIEQSSSKTINNTKIIYNSISHKVIKGSRID